MQGQIKPYPLLLAPTYKDYMWGGSRIAERYNREVPGDTCAESWEISDRPEGMGVVTNGPYKGQTLSQLMRLFGKAITGSVTDGSRFPLLIKLIDAKRDLSVQVHPNNANAHRTGGEPKTEMWYILDCDDGATIYAGMQPGTTQESLLDAMSRQALAEEVLAGVPAEAGQAIFVPGGRVHAIGAGCLLLEVQQNSNTTYRLYDWDRVGPDGKPRELHLDAALAVIDWNRCEPDVAAPVPLPPLGAIQREAVIDCRFFTTERWHVTGDAKVTQDGRSFHALFTIEGSGTVEGGGIAALLRPGVSCLLPAELQHYRLTPDDEALTLLHIALGKTENEEAPA